MSEIKPTPGEWFCGDWIPADHNTAGWVEVWTVDAEGNRSLPFVSCKHFDAGDNARIIAEAGTVFHTTGMTPMQLVERVRELEGALQAIVTAADSPMAERGEIWFAEAVATPIEDARAALAKCQGKKGDGK